MVSTIARQTDRWPVTGYLHRVFFKTRHRQDKCKVFKGNRSTEKTIAI